MSPVICMVTARQRSTEESDRALVERIRAAARAGVDLVQLREPEFEGRALMHLVEQSVLAVRGTRTRVLVNERVDVALAAGAHGVHLRGDSVSARRIRAITPAGFLIGRSVHSLTEAGRAVNEGDLDYLIFGTVFATPSKPHETGTGPEALAAVCAATAVPVLAIGGMSLERLGAVGKAGAAGFAAINLFADCDVDSLTSIVDRSARAFDTSDDVP
jgi:thiamine-phosphate pyrophosphorylase